MPEPKLAGKYVGLLGLAKLGTEHVQGRVGSSATAEHEPSGTVSWAISTSPHQPDPEVVGLNTLLGYAGLRTRLSLWARN